MLDCGCGIGTITVGLADALPDGAVVGVDLDPGGFAAARGYAAERELLGMLGPRVDEIEAILTEVVKRFLKIRGPVIEERARASRGDVEEDIDFEERNRLQDIFDRTRAELNQRPKVPSAFGEDALRANTTGSENSAFAIGGDFCSTRTLN